MVSDKVFITPDDWAMGDDERTFVESGPDFEPDWFYITNGGGVTFALHKEEIELLHAFACEGADDADKSELDKILVKCDKAKGSCAEACPHAGTHKANDDCERIVCSRINEYTECVPAEVKDAN